jgi:hypothetical protein
MQILSGISIYRRRETTFSDGLLEPTYAMAESLNGANSNTGRVVIFLFGLFCP